MVDAYNKFRINNIYHGQKIYLYLQNIPMTGLG